MDIFGRDFIWGIAKPIKDAVASLLLYAILSTFTKGATIQPTISSNVGFSFNIGIFLALFGGISFLDDMISQARSDFKKSYYKPLDQCDRIMGMLVGMIFFGLPLVGIYNLSGGSIEVGIISWFVSFAILIITMVLRVKIAEANRHYR